VTAVGVFAALLWNVVNEIRLREHSKALRANEAHLRVTSEIKLRLHEQSWALLREINAAALAAFTAIRTYNMIAIAAVRGVGTRGAAVSGKEFSDAEFAVQTFSGLAHVAPPDKAELREAASLYTKAFNLVNRSVLGEPTVGGIETVMKEITDALAAALVGTKAWNEELWRDQSVVALAKVDDG
jgi:hypothetical protein